MSNGGVEKTVRVLGVDPGLGITGYGVIEIRSSPDNRPEFKVIEAGVIRASRSGDLGRRLQTHHQEMTEVLQAHSPGAVALEKLYSHYKQPLTAITMGHVRGVICLAAAQAGCPLFHYSATQVKLALTGNGRAPKSQMQLAVMSQLQLTTIPKPADIADALAIAMCHCFLQQRNLLTP